MFDVEHSWHISDSNFQSSPPQRDCFRRATGQLNDVAWGLGIWRSNLDLAPNLGLAWRRDQRDDFIRGNLPSGYELFGPLAVFRRVAVIPTRIVKRPAPAGCLHLGARGVVGFAGEMELQAVLGLVLGQSHDGHFQVIRPGVARRTSALRVTPPALVPRLGFPLVRDNGDDRRVHDRSGIVGDWHDGQLGCGSATCLEWIESFHKVYQRTADNGFGVKWKSSSAPLASSSTMEM